MRTCSQESTYELAGCVTDAPEGVRFRKLNYIVIKQQVCISQNVDYFFKTWLAHAFLTLRMLRTLENKNKIMTGACSDHSAGRRDRDL